MLAGMTRGLALAAALLVMTAPALALDAPTSKIVLTISGKLGGANQTNQVGAAMFDAAMLAALPQRSVTTHTPWHKGEHKFTGPLLRDVLVAAGASIAGKGQMLEVMAINDYKVSIPLEDALRFDVVLARLMDDLPMALRDKGPLFVIYPFDTDPQLRSSIYFSRSAWQVKAIALR
jgi:hypothetical protein